MNEHLLGPRGPWDTGFSLLGRMMLTTHRDISWADGVLGQELGGQGLEEDRVTVLGRGAEVECWKVERHV